MKPEAYEERQLEVEGCPLQLTSYKLGGSQADNLSPGATLAAVFGARLNARLK
jgi:hypothetical protein